VEAEIAEDYGTLFTYYRGTRFDTADLERTLRAIRGQTDLIVLDHLHYVDAGEDVTENAALKDLVKTIRDASLSIGVPVIVVAHLRKKDRARRQIVPDVDDVHGSSDIAKVATKVIMLAPAQDQADSRPWIAPTFVHLPKDRMVSASGLVAVVGYDLRTASYETGYQLGRIVGDKWQALEPGKRPAWATGAL
jgi:hypothetical protein